MINTTERIIRRTQNRSKHAVADLLEMLFAMELAMPSKRLLIISPWISDLPVLDNRNGAFSQLESRWGATQIRFTEVLRTLLQRGVKISLATRTTTRNEDFISRLLSTSEMDGTLDNLNVSQDENNFLFEKEHSKGLISDTWALIGSMNFTYSGVEINGELVTFKTDPNSIGQLAAAFTDLFEAENE